MALKLHKILKDYRLEMGDIVDITRGHVGRSYDAYIPNCGREGKGKSHFSIRFMLEYMGIDEDSKEALWAIEKHVRYAEDCNVLKALKFYIDEAENGGFYIFDEAERMASKYDSSTIEARIIRKYWTISRKRSIISLLNMPMLANFDIYMRSGRAFMAFVNLARLDDKRGIAVVLYADEDSPDAFDLTTYYKAKKKSKIPILRRGPEEKIKFWSKCMSFAGVILTKPLPKKLEERYLTLANRTKQYQSLLDELKSENIYNQLYGGYARGGGYRGRGF